VAGNVDWSNEARKDLSDIVRFVAQHNPSAALEVLLKIESCLKQVAEFPTTGHFVPELPKRKDIRQKLVYSYRVIYRVHKGGVVTVSIIHAARDLNAFFKAQSHRLDS
jgi:toxin ParE1/3/4